MSPVSVGGGLVCCLSCSRAWWAPPAQGCTSPDFHKPAAQLDPPARPWVPTDFDG